MTPWPSTRRSRTDAIVQMTRSADGQHVPAPSPGPSLSAYAAGLPEVSRLIRQRIESGPGGTGASCPVPANSATGSGDTEAGATADILPAVAVAASVPVAAVTITWADDTVTTVHPPEAPARPVNATPAHWPRGLPGGPRLLGRRGRQECQGRAGQVPAIGSGSCKTRCARQDSSPRPAADKALSDHRGTSPGIAQ